MVQSPITRYIAVIGVFALLPVLSSAEDFDAPGSTWANTVFPAILASGGGTFVREMLGANLGAPNASPPLPINQGGDKEGRYFEQTLAPSSSYALTADLPQNDLRDATMDGYVAFGNPRGVPSSRSVSFVLRTSERSQISTVHAYAATINHFRNVTSSTATLRLIRIRNGILGGGDDTFVSSTRFSIDTSNQILRLRFRVVDDALTASLWSVEEVGGAVVETPVDLLSQSGVQNTISATDSELTSGRAGVSAFARSDSSVFFDDIFVLERRPGDPNCDGSINGGDIDPFFLALGDPAGYATQFPHCDVLNADMNGDGSVNGGDIDPFFVCLAGGSCP